MQLRVQERILTIRLIRKAEANPAHAEALGIVVVNSSANPDPYLPVADVADDYEQ